MTLTSSEALPVLPLLLWETPPAIEQMLTQEGVSFQRITRNSPEKASAGRFVLFDSQSSSSRSIRSLLTPQHVAIDVNALRDRSANVDPFADYIRTDAVHKIWTIGDYQLKERVSRFDKASLRSAVIGWIRNEVIHHGGVWVRLALYPFPYRSAFNFRADLDEPYPNDYFAFAKARKPIDDCSTHFVSTAAYADDRNVLDDLRGVDTQSHGHFHVVYRSESENRANLVRAHDILWRFGFAIEAFAAPEGRWNPGLDRVVEELRYQYSSDFSLGYDDLPFYPWLGGRFSNVLQVPVHPICEGLFLDAGCEDSSLISDHLLATLEAKVSRREPAFLYGHPERRLGRFPEVVSAIASAVGQLERVWRVTLGEFARWWKWRERRTWSLLPKAGGEFEIQVENWDVTYPLSLEIVRDGRVASMALTRPTQTVTTADLSFHVRPEPAVLPEPEVLPIVPNWRSVVKMMLDWETVTPPDEIPSDGFRNRLKRGLRTIRPKAQVVRGRSSR